MKIEEKEYWAYGFGMMFFVVNGIIGLLLLAHSDLGIWGAWIVMLHTVAIIAWAFWFGQHYERLNSLTNHLRDEGK